jgi:hypothetical protein
MTDDDEITNEIDERERACIRGHQETKARLINSPRWTEPDADELVRAAYSYEDFARCVLGELRFDRINEE